MTAGYEHEQSCLTPSWSIQELGFTQWPDVTHWPLSNLLEFVLLYIRYVPSASLFKNILGQSRISFFWIIEIFPIYFPSIYEVKQLQDSLSPSNQSSKKLWDEEALWFSPVFSLMETSDHMASLWNHFYMKVCTTNSIAMTW